MKHDHIQKDLEQFRSRLLAWFSENSRDLPWRKDKNPYLVWVSEIMLQQTRVDQARPYYRRFITAFPDIRALANASQDEVLKNWEGLGYYSRARNLHRAAKIVVDEYGARVPRDPEEFAKLPGVGPYTKAAVSSIAFNVPLAVVDGNLIRVISRLYSIHDLVNRGPVKRIIEEIATQLLDSDRPGDFNESMMELGATVCHPKKPSCEKCPVSDFCLAFARNEQEELPKKDKKKKVPHYDISIGVIADADGKYFIAKRPEDAMLGGLWEFPGGKKEEDESLEVCCQRELKEELGIDVHVGKEITRIKHAYSHFKITMHAFNCTIENGEPNTKNGMPFLWATKENLADYAFPKANRKLIDILLNPKEEEIRD